MSPEELATVVGIAAEAAELVKSIYEKPFSVEYKGPRDPVTEADRAANELICQRLELAFPSVPIVAEESAPDAFAGYRDAERVFFVDPVDGTQEFILKNGEFVVMIGLLEADAPTAAVIHAPATGTAWAGLVGYGAFELSASGERRPIHVSSTAELGRARLVSSRSHRTPELERTLSALRASEIIRQGSAGLKGARVAIGDVDAYVAPHYAGQRWDVCATDALVRAAGGKVSDASGRPIDYRAESLTNRDGLVASNGLLHDAILEQLAQTRAREPLS
jgi:3'(2'), 5'-bisphosphate nucleotidase